MPIDLDAILSDFTDKDEAWMIIEPVSAARLNIPDPKYPGIEVVRLFLSRGDAETVIQKLRSVPKGRITAATLLVAVPVPLLATMRAVAASRDAGVKIGFAVHSPNEVFDFQ